MKKFMFSKPEPSLGHGEVKGEIWAHISGTPVAFATMNSEAVACREKCIPDSWY